MHKCHLNGKMLSDFFQLVSAATFSEPQANHLATEGSIVRSEATISERSEHSQERSDI
jgi:hypothetical protein